MATYTDALNRSMNFDSPPQRIVSLVPSITEALFTFGLDETIVGVTQFCVEPPAKVAAKPKVGGTKTLNVRAVIDLQPDLIIANAEENRQEDIRQLLAAGQRVFVTFPRTVAAAIQMLRQLAQMTGTAESAAPYLDDAEQALHEARAANQHRPRLRVFAPIWRRPWMTVGSNTYMHDLIAACGGFNIFSERHERYPLCDLDEVARRQPEVILLPSEPYPFTEKHLAEILEYRSIPAVRNGRIYLLDGKYLCWYGPRMGPGIRYVQSLLWGPAEEEARDQSAATAGG
jgi:ABC-type Fe3+-hydroxamate transport system substrate-binding protein